MSLAEQIALIKDRAAKIAKRSTSGTIDGWAAEIDSAADAALLVAPTIIERRRGERRTGADMAGQFGNRVGGNRRGGTRRQYPATPVVTRVTIATSGQTLNFAPTETYQLVVEVAADAVKIGDGPTYSYAVLTGRTVTYVSSDTDIATVSAGGLVTGVANGSATITATCEGVSATQGVYITTPQGTVSTVTISPSSASVTEGFTTILSAVVRDASSNILTGKTVTWASSNTGLATVSADSGDENHTTTVTGVAAGSPTVTATCETVDSSAATITVSAASATYPNQPVGATLHIAVDGTTKSLPSQPAGDWTYSAAWDTSGITVESTNDPYSSGSSLRWNFPTGFVGGSGPGRAVQESSANQSFSTYYIGIVCRWSYPWTNNDSSVNKLLYWGEKSADLLGYPTSQFYLNRRDTVIDACLQYGQNYAGQVPVPDTQRVIPLAAAGESRLASTSVNDNNWHLVEMKCVASTGGTNNGSLTVWVDNIKQFEVTNCRFAPTGDALFYGVDLDPVYGGGETPLKPGDEYFEIGDLRISGTV